MFQLLYSISWLKANMPKGSSSSYLPVVPLCTLPSLCSTTFPSALLFIENVLLWLPGALKFYGIWFHHLFGKSISGLSISLCSDMFTLDHLPIIISRWPLASSSVEREKDISHNFFRQKSETYWKPPNSLIFLTLWNGWPESILYRIYNCNDCRVTANIHEGVGCVPGGEWLFSILKVEGQLR